MNPIQILENPKAMPSLYTLLTLTDIDIPESRLKFEILYSELLKTGPLFYDEKDIIKKDVRRLPRELFTNLEAVYPELTENSFKQLTDDILRIITRFSLSSTQKLAQKVEYIQGMHEIVGVSLQIALEQASGPNSPEVSAHTEECAADAWAFSNHLISELLPSYVDNSSLVRFCGYVKEFIGELDEELLEEVNNSAVPPFETFCQRSIYLFFARDFELDKISEIWVMLISMIKIYENETGGPFDVFPAFVLASLFVWRYRNMAKLNIEMIEEVFLEQDLLYNSSNTKEFLVATIKNFESMVLNKQDFDNQPEEALQSKIIIKEEETMMQREQLKEIWRKTLEQLGIIENIIINMDTVANVDDCIINIYDKLQQVRFQAEDLLEVEDTSQVSSTREFDLRGIYMESFKIKRNWQLLQPE